MKQAIIAGGSIAGLASARALSAKFDKILIVEPDALDTGKTARKGTPQARHVHGLLKGGSDALTVLFPNLPSRLREEGAVSCDFSQEVRWYLNKRWMPRFKGDLPIYFQTRPLLEYCVREEVRTLRNVEFLTGARVRDYLLDEAGRRVVAALVEDADGAMTRMEADFFVDTTGRGSLLPQWLQRNGFGEIREERVGVNLGYASCLMALRDEARDWKSILIYPTGPDEIRGATLVRVEDNKWLLTLAGYHNVHPPADPDGFMEFARNLPRKDIYNAIQGATMMTEISLHKFPHGQRRYYGELPSFPLALLPVGDSNASLNPLFGQGMSAVALSAAALGRRAGAADFDSLESLTQLHINYFRDIADILKTPWDLALGQDFRYSMTSGMKPRGMKIKNMLKGLIMGAASLEVIEHFYRVVHLVAEERSFYHPKWLFKYFFGRKKMGVN